MKVLYIYNPHSSNELQVLDRVKNELGTSVTMISIDNTPDIIKKLITMTPVLIPISLDLQGSHILNDDIDGKLIALAIINKRLEEEELALFNQETSRLDNLVNNEIIKSEEKMLMEMIIEGRI